MKVRLTALSISSIDMKIVIMFRRKRNPATPSTKRTALRIRYQEMGTPVILIPRRWPRNGPDFVLSQTGVETSLDAARTSAYATNSLIHLLQGQHDRADNGDQDQQ